MATVIRQQRSPTKFAPADWHTSNFIVSSSAKRQLTASHTVRQESHTLCNDTENLTRWTQHKTGTSLTQRVTDIQNWRDNIKKTLEGLEMEISQLVEYKERCEWSLEAKGLPLEVVIECMTLREQRTGTDLVADDAENELQKELNVIGGVRKTLHQKINEAFEQVCVLREAQQQLSDDLADKTMAVGIDSQCTELNNSSDTLCFHDDPTRIKKGIVTPEQWQRFSAHNMARAQQAMVTSEKLRHAINHSILQTTNQLEAQWHATDYTLRKRLHETELAKNELEWKKENIEREIAELEETVAQLQQSLDEKTAPHMVVHTRLENRTLRPGMELCRDSSQHLMVEEMAQIIETQQTLMEKLTTARQTLGTLQRTLQRIKKTLEGKITCIAIDQQCMEVRGRLKEHPKAQDLLQPPAPVPE